MNRNGKAGQYVRRSLSAVALIAVMYPIHAGTDPQKQPEPMTQASARLPLEDDPIAKRSESLASNDIQSMRSLAVGKGYTFTIGPNPATRRPMHELCGLVMPTEDQLRAERPTAPAVKALRGLPSRWDWREHGGNVTVRDQGGCGSCWAFGTVGPLETNIKIKDGIDVDLSEQYLVSCNAKGYNCSGGWFVHDMHVNPGAVMESCFPYQASNAYCKTGCANPYRIESWGSVANNVDQLKSAIYQYGPISTTVAVDSYFSAYTGGVFNRNYSGQINHAVVLVGWDDSTQSWILRNSWAADWGEGGYMRIAYGCSSVGYGSYYVVYKGGSVPPPSGGPAGYTKCANENGSYTFSQTVDVAYGANGKFAFRNGVTGTIAFNNSVFGDPIYGVFKAGYYRNSSTPSGSNVAQGKTTWQSSTPYGTWGGSSCAVDGNTDGNWSSGSVTHTNYEYNAWWEVDLGATYQVSKITLWNRTDCCGERLSNFTVAYLTRNGIVITTQTYSQTAGVKTDFNLPVSGVGRVEVWLNGVGILSLAEVQVFGTLSSDEPPFAKVADENQTVPFGNLADVAYGGKGIFAKKFGVTGHKTFDNATFGDPVPGLVKSGYVMSSSTASK